MVVSLTEQWLLALTKTDHPMALSKTDHRNIWYEPIYLNGSYKTFDSIHDRQSRDHTYVCMAISEEPNCAAPHWSGIYRWPAVIVKHILLEPHVINGSLTLDPGFITKS